tara:strand:+ start:280 stop:984 length:705 start_codon:yes stop_codon:yes gene_type:complete
MIAVLGDGFLATEVIGQTGWSHFSRREDGIDFNNIKTIDRILPKNCNTVVNCIANTDTYSENRETMLRTNYESIIELVKLCNKRKISLIHYSTDYVYAGSVSNAKETDIPIPDRTWYAYSKLLADEYIISNSNDYLIVRGSHRISPFPYDKAWSNQIGNFDSVDVLVLQWIKLIESGETGVWNIGTHDKSVYDLAILSNDRTEPAMAPPHFPLNTTMDLSKINEFLEKYEDING